MKKLKEFFRNKNSLFMILIIGYSLIWSFTLISINNDNSFLKSRISDLETIICNYESDLSDKSLTIEELESKVNDLNSQLNKEKKLNEDYKSKISKLESDNKKLKNLSNSYTNVNSNSHSNEQPIANDTGFRSWMPYTAINAVSSIEYKVSRMATPNSYGIMCINSNPLVAIGTGWNISTGSIISIKTTSCTFLAVVSDHKSPSCTDSANKVGYNGCSCEFLIDTSCLSSVIRNSGNVASIGTFGGKIISITKVGSVI